MVKNVIKAQNATWRTVIAGLIAAAGVAMTGHASAQTDASEQMGPSRTIADTPRSGVLLDRIVAVVNDGVVLKSQLDKQVRSITARLSGQDVQLPPQDVFERQILERLVIEELQLQRAEQLGIQVTDDVVNIAVAGIAERNNVQLEHLPGVLASQGIDYVTYRDDLRREIVLEQLRSRDLLSRISVSREEAEKYLKSKSAQDNSEYEISQILISVPSDASPEKTADALTKAEEVYEKLENGESFGSMAVSYSSGQQALNGGKIGWRKRQELPTIFADEVAALAPGKFSKPIRSSSGFHIVRLDQKRGDNTKQVIVTEHKARHILVEINELRTDSDAQGKALTLLEQIRNGEDFATLARNNSDDTGTANDGGDLGWSGPGTFVPKFEETLNSLKKGEISEPVLTRFGYHIIELLDSRQQDKTSEAQLNEAAMQIRSRKAQEEGESWILRLRDEAFVEYRL